MSVLIVKTEHLDVIIKSSLKLSLVAKCSVIIQQGDS